LLLGTITDNFGLQTRISRHLAASDFKSAMKYDYRKIKDALDVYTRNTGNTRDVAVLLDLPLVEAEFVLDYYKVMCQKCLGYRWFDDLGNVWRGQTSTKLTLCPKCST